MLVVFAPQILLYGLAVVLYGILQAHRRFTAPALAPVVSSFVVITAYLAFVSLGHGYRHLCHLPRLGPGSCCRWARRSAWWRCGDRAVPASGCGFGCGPRCVSRRVSPGGSAASPPRDRRTYRAGRVGGRGHRARQRAPGRARWCCTTLAGRCSSCRTRCSRCRRRPPRSRPWSAAQGGTSLDPELAGRHPRCHPPVLAGAPSLLAGGGGRRLGCSSTTAGNAQTSPTSPLRARHFLLLLLLLLLLPPAAGHRADVIAVALVPGRWVVPVLGGQHHRADRQRAGAARRGTPGARPAGPVQGAARAALVSLGRRGGRGGGGRRSSRGGAGDRDFSLTLVSPYWPASA